MYIQVGHGFKEFAALRARHHQRLDSCLAYGHFLFPSLGFRIFQRAQSLSEDVFFKDTVFSVNILLWGEPRSLLRKEAFCHDRSSSVEKEVIQNVRRRLWAVGKDGKHARMHLVVDYVARL